MNANIEEMGLNYIEEYIDYTTLSVVDWAKFFPVINIQAEKFLIAIAKIYWWANVSYNSVKNNFIFDVKIIGINESYSIIRQIGEKYNDELEQKFIKSLCPYSENDIRKYVWINILKQYNYAKICKNTQNVLIDLLVGKK